MTLDEWRTLSRDLTARASAVSTSILERAREAARKAGIDPSIPFLHAHNAMVSLHYGRPWREVDYSLVRLVLWLEEKMSEPHRVADRIIRRKMEEIEWR